MMTMILSAPAVHIWTPPTIASHYTSSRLEMPLSLLLLWLCKLAAASAAAEVSVVQVELHILSFA